MRVRSDICLAMTGLHHEGGTPSDQGRALIEWMSDLPMCAVRLDLSRHGLRPRELDRSARRDLAALLRRRELDLFGADLWIPPKHFSEDAWIDRAMAAAMSSLDLLGDLRSLGAASRPRQSLGLRLPSSISEELLATLTDHAALLDLLIADHVWPPRADAAPSHRVGLDPAVLLAAGQDPAHEAVSLGDRLACARLTDVSGPTRVEPGCRDGSLDVLGYAAALHAGGYGGWVVLDVTGLPDQRAVIEHVAGRWPSVPAT